MAQKNRKKTTKKESINDINNSIKIVVIVLVVIVGVYFLTSCASKNGKFSTDYIPLETPEAVITYEEATIGMVFNRNEKEYYVIFEDFGNTNKSLINTIVNSYIGKEEHKPLYKVNMSLDVNSKYKSNKSNKKAKNSEELKIKTPTLIYIKNGKISKYIEGNDKIKSELK